MEKGTSWCAVMFKPAKVGVGFLSPLVPKRLSVTRNFFRKVVVPARSRSSTIETLMKINAVERSENDTDGSVLNGARPISSCRFLRRVMYHKLSSSLSPNNGLRSSKYSADWS